MKRYFPWLAGFLLITLLPVSAYYWVSTQGNTALYYTLSEVPQHDTALILGTAPTVQGRPNLYYVYRIQAAGRLFRAGKFRRIIASGARRPGYDEMGPMQRDLQAEGIPAAQIELDPEGVRTRASIERADSVFGLQRYLIISQGFHNQRALYIAKRLGQEPVAFSAEDPPFQPAMLLRELASRTVAILESYP